MERMNARRKYQADVEYEVWRSGGNPDLVDRECTDDCFDEGRYPEECAMDELKCQRPDPQSK